MKSINSILKKKGFTLVELLIVIAIIGILTTLAIVNFNQARMRARDVKRVSDVYHTVNALNFYYTKNNTYPAMITAGEPINSFLSSVPSNPWPRSERSCADSDYSYVYSTATNRFALGYCLEADVGNLVSGLRVATPESLTQSSLVNWWKFDERSGNTVLDYSGNLVGTIYGATWQADCRLGACLSFDGYNDYVGLASETLAGVKTIIVWIYINDISNNHQAIFGNHLMQLHANDGLSYKGSSGGYIFSEGTINEQEWTHVAFVFDDDNDSLKFYINGAAVSEETLTDFSLTATEIGILSPGSGSSKQPFDGLIDDVRIYNKVLPNIEIQALYNASKD